MRTRRKIELGVGAIAVLTVTGGALYPRAPAHRLVTNAASIRKLPCQTRTADVPPANRKNG